MGLPLSVYNVVHTCSNSHVMLGIMTDFLLLVLAPNLTKVTAVVGLWGWTTVSLAVGTLIMFYRCSR